MKVILNLVAFALVGVALAETSNGPMVFKGFRLERVEARHWEGDVWRARLKGVQSTAFGGNKISIHKEIHFHENGNLGLVRLAKPHVVEVGGNKFTVEGQLTFYEGGALRTLITHGNGNEVVVAGRSVGIEPYLTEFYESGQVKSVLLSKDEALEVGGQTFKAKARRFVRLHGDGSVWSLSLLGSKEVVVGGKTYSVEGKVRFRSDGGLAFAELSSPGNVDVVGKALPASSVEFYEGGGLKKTTLKDSHEVVVGKQKLVIRGGASFTSKGALQSVELAGVHSLNIGAHEVKVHGGLLLHASGAVRRVILQKTQRLALDDEGYEFAKDSFLEFYESGRVRRGQLMNGKQKTFPDGADGDSKD